MAIPHHGPIFKITPYRLFLLDGLGALLTVVLLAGLVAPRQAVFGMPSAVVYPLAIAVCSYAVYSLACSLLRPRRWRPWLRGIAAANAAYCVVTLAAVAWFYPQMTTLGLAYFAVEAALLVAIAWFEWRFAAAAA
jgi:hypothetical protein